MSRSNPASPRHAISSKAPARAVGQGSRALLVIDHGRLQREAWAELQAVRKRIAKMTRELHRHEDVDVPAYEAWLSRQFPLQVSALRELKDEVASKSRRIRMIKAMAAYTGRSAKRLWREQKEGKATLFRGQAQPEPEAESEEASERRKDARLEDFDLRRSPPRSANAREIYRRLVQHLHPDRGGDWNAARQNLWHEVQLAWAAGDADWLARLESEWETAHATVGPQSPVGRLRAAVEELYAAERDVESKLAAYREALAWRFTLTPAKRSALERRVMADFEREAAALRRQLKELDLTIGRWDEDWTRADTRLPPKSRPTGFQWIPRRPRKPRKE